MLRIDRKIQNLTVTIQRGVVGQETGDLPIHKSHGGLPRWTFLAFEAMIVGFTPRGGFRASCLNFKHARNIPTMERPNGYQRHVAILAKRIRASARLIKYPAYGMIFPRANVIQLGSPSLRCRRMYEALKQQPLEKRHKTER